MGRRNSGYFLRAITRSWLFALFLANTTRADDTGAPYSPSPRGGPGGQRTFGFGPTLGLQSGTGAIVAIGSPFGVLLSGGYVPVLTGATQHETRAPEYDIYSSAQINVELTLVPWHPSPKSALGIVAGYKYNTVLGHGGGAGVSWRYDLGRKAAFFGIIGGSLFPGAEHELITHHGYPTDRDLIIPWLQGGFNAGIMVYP